ncbi:unnamed protein product, partial [Closterium sp. NIES-54]
SILTSIAASFGPSNPPFNAWTGSDPCGTAWPGVSCLPAPAPASDTSVVTGLNLQQLNLSGNIPASIFDLTTLNNLDLSLNPSLSGSLPSTISQFTNLTSLYLYGCGLEGSLPDTLTALSTLIRFDVNTNRFNGSLPAEMSALRWLFYFDVTSNQLGGAVPAFGTRVGHLHLSNNNFTSLSPALSSLKSLIHL